MPDPDTFVRSSIPMPACIQNQHDSLWQELCQAKRDVRTLAAELEKRNDKEEGQP